MAEHFVRKMKRASVPVVCYRPGMVTANTTTGASNPTDFINRYQLLNNPLCLKTKDSKAAFV